MIEILFKTTGDFIAILPVLLIAVFVSQIINSFLSKKKLDRKIRGKTNILEASLIGVGTPGPLIAFLPLLKILKKRGVSLGVIAAFMTGQTLIGPMRFFLETNYFGAVFFFLRVIISVFIAILIGIIFSVAEKKFDFSG